MFDSDAPNLGHVPEWTVFTRPPNQVLAHPGVYDAHFAKAARTKEDYDGGHHILRSSVPTGFVMTPVDSSDLVTSLPPHGVAPPCNFRCGVVGACPDNVTRPRVYLPANNLLTWETKVSNAGHGCSGGGRPPLVARSSPRVCVGDHGAAPTSLYDRTRLPDFGG